MENAREAAFTEAMEQVYHRAKEECGYDAKRYLIMLKEHRGVETAKRLLRSDVSEGYLALMEQGRLDLTVEALVVKPEWRELFEPKDVENALAKLPPELHPKEGSGPPPDSLRLVADARAIAANVTAFQVEAPRHAPRALTLLRQTTFWVFERASQSFAPNKFLAYEGMTFNRYESIVGQQPMDGDRFDGNVARTTIESVLGAGYHEDEALAQRCRLWGEALLGAEAFGGVDTKKWQFITLNIEAGRFVPGRLYTRQDVHDILGVPENARGGNWDTGYTRHNGEWFIFTGVGAAGRTGHVYGSHWIGEDLYWRGRTDSRIDHPSIQDLTSGVPTVHVFTRGQERSPFTYEGEATAKEVLNTVPVTVIWQFRGRTASTLPEEVPPSTKYWEGATRKITVNAYERNPEARRKCKEHYGTLCAVCGFDFGQTYGPLAQGFIHVHHLRKMADIGAEYQVDPIKDLRPVCPNCHAVLHMQDPPMSVEDLKSKLKDKKS